MKLVNYKNIFEVNKIKVIRHPEHRLKEYKYKIVINHN